jgi:propanol-preferring alcohol dehydrogenase
VKAWVVAEPKAIDDGPLAPVERPTPDPGPHEIRVQVSACGVCRTDLPRGQ